MQKIRIISDAAFLKVVGEEGFEPPTLWSQTRCATKLRYSPRCLTKTLSVSTRAIILLRIFLTSVFFIFQLVRLFIHQINRIHK